jgi:hypothetical protein
MQVFTCISQTPSAKLPCLTDVAHGYRAMDDRTALKVLVKP